MTMLAVSDLQLTFELGTSLVERKRERHVVDHVQATLAGLLGNCYLTLVCGALFA